MNQITTGKMGFKGHVVMPQKVRELLGVEQGSTIAWVITDKKSIEVRSINIEGSEEPNEFELALAELGMTYEDWRAQRKEFAKKYRAAKLKKEQAEAIAKNANA